LLGSAHVAELVLCDDRRPDAEAFGAKQPLLSPLGEHQGDGPAFPRAQSEAGATGGGDTGRALAEADRSRSANERKATDSTPPHGDGAAKQDDRPADRRRIVVEDSVRTPLARVAPPRDDPMRAVVDDGEAGREHVFVGHEELEQLTWLSREEGSATRAVVEAARWQAGLRAVRTLELPSWEAVKLAVAGGGGIAAISRFALELELAAGALIVLKVPRWRLVRTIGVVTARDVPLTRPAELFIELLRREWGVRGSRVGLA
jgi:LysR substrate binding domain